MRPILFHWHGYRVFSYPAMLYVGTVLGVFAGNQAAHAAGLDAFHVWIATMTLFAAALAGARLLYVAIEWHRYRRRPRRIFDPNQGGAAQYGGLLVAVPLSWPLLAALGVPYGGFWDVAAITILVAMTFTRVGCLLNGCCAGRPVRTFGLMLPNTRGEWRRRVPAPILEIALAVALLMLGLRARPLLPAPGALFLLVAGGYAVGRLALETLREHPADTPAFNIQHALSLAIAVASFALLAMLWRH
jgi:prolipoprotein diacylglyceryltransferase